MNRIYQGRVTKVEVRVNSAGGQEPDWCLLDFTPETLKDLEAERQQLRLHANENSSEGKQARQRLAEIRRQLNDPWQTVLWRHHQLFQDSVNFYLAAFAAMVPQDCNDKRWRDFRDSVVRTWEAYSGRQGSWKWPFARVCQAIGCAEEASFQSFSRKLFSLTNSKATPGQRYAALREVFDSAVAAAQTMISPDELLEESLKGKGKKLFNKLVVLCARRTGEISGEIKDAQRIGAREATSKVKAGKRLSWDDVFLFKTSPGGEAWSREKVRGELLQYFDDVLEHLAERAKSLETKAKDATKSEQTAKIEEQRRVLSSLTNGMRKRRKEFEKWVNDPKAELPDRKPSRKGSGGYDLKSAALLALRPKWPEFREVFLLLNDYRLNEQNSVPREDMCYTARFAGGIESRVFPFFLDVWSQRLNDDSIGQGVWPDFEKQAFIEVFNKVGQFVLRERKFELRLDEANKVIERIEAQLEHDTLLQRIKDIADELAAKSEAVNEDGTPRLYSIREQTLKSWPKVRRAWRTLIAKDANVTDKELLDEKKRLQARFREKFGSAALFDALAVHREIWNHDNEDPLPIWARYVEAKEEKEHLEAERLFAPAHPIHSPRYFRWAETNNKTHLPASSDGALMVDVDVLDLAAKKKSKARLHFRAPRLLRDGLRKSGEKLGEPDQIWLPPVLRPLVEKYQWKCDPQTFVGTAVRLAPRSDTDIQLVFEPELNAAQMSLLWKSRFPFTANNRKVDGEWKVTGVRWQRDSEKFSPWQEAGELKCLGVDLGLVNSAAWHVLHAVREDKLAKKARLMHKLTPQSMQHQWHAYSIANGIVRVAGEERWVWRRIRGNEKIRLLAESEKPKEKRSGFGRKFFAMNGEVNLRDAMYAFLPELSGSAGRNATVAEIEEAEILFRRLKAFGYDINERLPDWKKLRSFPEQNDDLLWGLKRVRGQLFRLHRWGVQLSPKSKEKSVLSALAVISNLKPDDPLAALMPLKDNLAELRNRIASLWQDYRDCLVEVLPVIANRVLPVRRGTWTWITDNETGWSKMTLDTNKPRATAWLAGQRGLSLARLNQLRDLRQLVQSLNHLCRHKADEHYQIRLGEVVPEPFLDCLKALEDAREDRAKQIAHEIFAVALGVELAPPPRDKAKRKATESLHGVYRCAERGPVNFIALEDLAGYRMSFKRSRRENRQLAAWTHRRVHKILQELCEIVGLPIVTVPAEFTSHLSAKDHAVGFRAEEVRKNDPRRATWLRVAREEDDSKWTEFVQWLDALPDGKSLLVPKRGGEVFVSLSGELNGSPDAVVYHADLNAAFRVALRALTHNDCEDTSGIVWLGGKTPAKRSPYIIDVANKLPGSILHPSGVRALPLWKAEDAWEQIYGDIAWRRCQEINAARIKLWQRKLIEEDVPF